MLVDSQRGHVKDSEVFCCVFEDRRFRDWKTFESDMDPTQMMDNKLVDEESLMGEVTCEK